MGSPTHRSGTVPLRADDLEERILILAPSRRDAPTVAGILASAGLVTEICPDLARFCDAQAEGVGAALIAEEALTSEGAVSALSACLERQPAWSELPLVMVSAAPGRGILSRTGPLRFAVFGSAIVLERPLRSATLVSAMRSALRARRRQYDVRDYLVERQRTEERLRAQEQELRQLNQTLEDRVRDRTAKLEDANKQLCREMQQREEAERALRQSQKMEAIGQLTGGIAHDFNNLLMVVTSGLSMLERATDPTRRDRIIMGMRQAAARGEALTRQLLAFSRRVALSPEPVDLGVLLESMHILVSGALRGDIGVHVKVPDDLWPVMADPTQLELAVLNAAVNARDAMPKGGSMNVEASNVLLTGTGEGGLTGEFVRIEIRDTGTGIPPDILDRVFDPFFTTKSVDKGTGLGLSQVYGFARQSGGHVEIRSRVGEGTSVVLYLPRARATPKQQTKASGERKRLNHAGRSVLLVEDNDEVALLAREMFEGLGFLVTRAANGPEALDALADGRSFDLVFSDIVMPGGINGFDLAGEVKERHPGLPVVLTTGYSDALNNSKAAMNLRVLPKPYDLSALETVLAEMKL